MTLNITIIVIFAINQCIQFSRHDDRYCEISCQNFSALPVVHLIVASQATSVIISVCVQKIILLFILHISGNYNGKYVKCALLLSFVLAMAKQFVLDGEF